LLHYCTKEILLVEPHGKQMYAHIRQTRCDLDDLCASGHRPLVGRSARAPLATIDLPGHPPPVEMADTHGKRSLVLSNLVE
jgi:hypothetical protein